MIGSLVGAAGIAVVSVLVGEFNDALGKALFTLFLVTIHALLSLAYIDNSTKRYGTELKFFSNIIFVILVLSFFTSVFGVWNLFDVEVVLRLYGTYGILAFASLHGEMLYGMVNKKPLIDSLVYLNYVFMLIVIALLLPIVWMDTESFGDFYFRLLAAAGIVDATLTILAVINYKLYLQKHPEENSLLFSYKEVTDENGNVAKVRVEDRKRKIHPLLIILGLYLAVQVFGGLLVAVI